MQTPFFDAFPVGPFQCNCTILGCKETGEGIVIDPGGDSDKISAVLAAQNLRPRFILHTHAHLDHVGGTNAVHKTCGGQTCLHEDDMPLCNRLDVQADLFGLEVPDTPTIDHFLKDGASLSFGKHSVEVLHTPGHTPGSLSFFIADLGLWTGDTLFFRSIGRTDLWGGSHPTLIASIHNKLLSFPEETRVYPGHGPKTAIGIEKKENPYLQ
ncbi:MAG: MBL fold metallo-hydrolase [Nitrospiria bacterium]